ncbi:MAG: sigma-70 family RNA polymerase sigma factor [Acidimicrobiales bacterium]
MDIKSGATEGGVNASLTHVTRRAPSSPPKAGNDALERLYEDECQPMLRLAVLVVGSRELAEDIVQDAFAAVTANRSSVSNPGGYLRQSVVNGCRMAIRRRDTQRAYLATLPTDGQLADAPHQLDLRDALGALPPKQRLVLMLRYLEDLPDREIAGLVGCTQATVRSLAFRGLRKMRETW